MEVAAAVFRFHRDEEGVATTTTITNTNTNTNTNTTITAVDTKEAIATSRRAGIAAEGNRRGDNGGAAAAPTRRRRPPTALSLPPLLLLLLPASSEGFAAAMAARGSAGRLGADALRRGPLRWTRRTTAVSRPPFSFSFARSRTALPFPRRALSLPRSASTADGDEPEGVETEPEAARAEDGIGRRRSEPTAAGLSSLAESVGDRVRHLANRAARGASGYHDDGGGTVIPIVVAVSGGCDSVALFHALIEWTRHLRRERRDEGGDRGGGLDVDITVVHFHHRQRPVEADLDCALVRELVASHNSNRDDDGDGDGEGRIAFRLEDWWDQDDHSEPRNAPSSSSSAGAAAAAAPPPPGEIPSFSQDAARRWRNRRLRYRALERVASLRAEGGDRRRSVPLGIVLTAHHDDDSYETVLIKLLRGVHLLNLHDRATIATIAPMNDHRGEEDDDEAEGALSGRAPPGRSVDAPGPGGDDDGDDDRFGEDGSAAPPIYLVRPFVGSAVVAAASSGSPAWRGHTKDDLAGYLRTRNLRWREDASNHDPSSRYLRNRVRNELIPLLADLTDDSFRAKRIPALLAQSLEAGRDIEPRALDHLARATAAAAAGGSGGDGGTSAAFAILPRGDDGDSDLVRSQALHRWMTACVDGDAGGGGGGVSYECLQRVVRQIEDHPRRKRWTLEVGSSWNLRRAGDVLTMTRDGGGGGETDDDRRDRRWTWTRGPDRASDGDDDDDFGDASTRLVVRVPSEWLVEPTVPPEFESVSLAEAERRRTTTTPLRFVPPWRSSPRKLRAFLRGRNVPAHERDAAELLLATRRRTAGGDGEEGAATTIVAVRVRSSWTIDREFHPGEEPRNDDDEEEEEDASVLLTLRRGPTRERSSSS